MKHAAGSSLYFREQKLNKIKYITGYMTVGVQFYRHVLKNQSDILCRLHCSQKNAVNYMPFILMCLNLLASCCLQQIFQLTLVVCCSGSNIVVFWASNTANASVLLLEFSFTTLASWKLKLHGCHRLPLKGGFLGCAHHATWAVQCWNKEFELVM